MEQFLEMGIDNVLFDYMNINDLIKLRINKNLKKIINNNVFLNDKINTIYDNIFKIISILTKAYDNHHIYGVKSFYHEHLSSGFSSRSSKSGIIIESYYSSLISTIYTPFGNIKPTGSYGYYEDSKKLNDYLHTQLTMVEIAKNEFSYDEGSFGPWYLLTHINNIEIDHPPIKLYQIINHMFRDNIIYYNYILIKIIFNKQIERLMKTQKINDTQNIISKLITDENYYNEAVKILMQKIKSEYIYIDKYNFNYTFIFKLILECHIHIFN